MSSNPDETTTETGGTTLSSEEADRTEKQR